MAAASALTTGASGSIADQQYVRFERELEERGVIVAVLRGEVASDHLALVEQVLHRAAGGRVDLHRQLGAAGRSTTVGVHERGEPLRFAKPVGDAVGAQRRDRCQVRRDSGCCPAPRRCDANCGRGWRGSGVGVSVAVTGGSDVGSVVGSGGSVIGSDSGGVGA